MCLILWDNTPTESTYSQLHSPVLSERKSVGKGNPRVAQSTNMNQYSLENSLVPYFSDWQRDLPLSVNILSTVREKIIHCLWHKYIKTNSLWTMGFKFKCFLICVSKGCTYFILGYIMMGKWLAQGRNWGCRMEEIAERHMGGMRKVLM